MRKNRFLKQINKFEKYKYLVLLIPLILIGFIIFEVITLNTVTFPEFNNSYTKIKASQTQTPSPTPEKSDQAIVTPATIKPTSTPHSVPILMYHHIRDYNVTSDPLGIDLSLSPVLFENHIKLIQSKKFTFITMADFSAKKFHEKDIILTFDDGYDNFYTTVFPLLKQYQIKATVYIITGKIDQPGYLTSNNLTELKNSNLVEIGAHTISHVDLTKASKATATDQIVNSKMDAESFCYPSGKYNDTVVQVVKEAGYKNATTTVYGIAKSTDNPFLLPRVRIKTATNLTNILKNI